MSAGFDWWEPVVWEFSSAAVLFALVPAQLAFERRFPFRSDRWRRVLPWHLLATVPYSLIHVLGMVGLRQVAYDAVGEVYRFGYWPTGLLYEYLKDVRTYALVLGLVYLYPISPAAVATAGRGPAARCAGYGTSGRARRTPGAFPRP